MRIPALFLFACLSLSAIPAHAILPQAPSSQPAGQETTASAIGTQSDAQSDARIAGRIRGIFLELPGLEDVAVEVSEGVVTLSGKVAEPDDKARAEAIASRVSGVVTVENTIKRSVNVDEGLGRLGGLESRFESFVALFPVIGAALVVAALIAAIGYLLASLTGLWRRVAPNSFLAELIASAIRFIFVVGGIVIALDIIGAGALLGAVLGGAGVIGIALGFAMRDTVENYVASLMLSLRQPFRANDWVVIDQHEGRVIRLTSRATILMTLDGNHLRIPNSAVFKAVILNYTRNPQRRFEFDIGIDAEDDPTAARHLGVDILKGLDFVLADPEPQGRVEAVGDSNIVIKFLGWIDQNETDWYKARSRAIPAVKNALEAAGFAIPEPIYRLRFDNAVPTAEAVGLPPSQERRHPSPAAGEAPQDTKPEDEIARMVEEERASSSAGEKDLLDPRRPVE